MRRWTTALLIGSAACGGRMRVDALPPAAPIDPAPTAPAQQPPPPPALPPRIPITRADTAPAFQLRLARDSAADAAALDSLAKVAPAPALPDLPIAAKATWDLDVESFSDQPRVKYYLDYFTGRAHDRFQVWLDRMQRYEPYARAQFAARRLPGDFVYLALIESGFSPEAVSRTYAVGIWQFMVGTARLYGLRTDTWVDERRDPIKATDAAAHHLEDLTNRFGSHYLAAAAYNAGAGRVQRGLGRMSAAMLDEDSVDVSSDDAFFSLADTRMIRDETKNYVPQLIAAAILAKEPERYGFRRSDQVVPFTRDSVIVDGGTGLDLIARLADTSLEAMRDLNPHLLRLVTPPGVPYPVRVPAGMADRVSAEYAALPAEQRHAIEPHQVRSGETVLALARKYGSTVDLIRSANRNARGRALSPGTTVFIPVSTTIPATLLHEPDPPRTVRFITRTYLARAGESLSSMARRIGVPVASLSSDNDIAPTARLKRGQRIVAHRTVTVAVGRPVASRVAAVGSSRASSRRASSQRSRGPGNAAGVVAKPAPKKKKTSA